MKRIGDITPVSRRDIVRGMSSASAVYNAARFIFALRYYFFGFWHAPAPI